MLSGIKSASVTERRQARYSARIRVRVQADLFVLITWINDMDVNLLHIPYGLG